MACGFVDFGFWIVDMAGLELDRTRHRHSEWKSFDEAPILEVPSLSSDFLVIVRCKRCKRLFP
jgi:hypothetical protein